MKTSALVRRKFLVELVIIGIIALAHESIIVRTNAAARLVRLPLARGITQQAGQYGQPTVTYSTQIQIGTPPKNFLVQFDLDLQEHFVPHYSWNPFNRNLHYGTGFQCKVSSSCKKDDRSVSVDYQNCQLTGKKYEDFVSLFALPDGYQANTAPVNQTNNVQTSKLIKWRQNFLAVSSASDGRFSQLPIDGFLGLAPTPQSATGLKSILVSLHEQKQIDNLQISMWFNPVLDSPNGGELILGGVDPARYQGQIYWHHLSTTNYNRWSLGLQTVTLGNQYVSCLAGSNCQVRFSSALSDIYGPPEDVKKIHTLLNTSPQSNGLQLIDCRRMAQLPTLSFMIDGIPYAMLPSNYIRKTVDGVIFKKETCYVAILPNNEMSSNSEWILGNNFLGAYYSIYDVTYRQIGFAALR